MLASLVGALGLHAGGLVLPSRPAATSRATVRLVSDDNGAAFEAFEKARAMKVSEIKAELGSGGRRDPRVPRRPGKHPFLATGFFGAATA